MTRSNHPNLNQFTEADSNWIIGGLGTALTGLLLWIKGVGTKLIMKRNNDIENKLTTLTIKQEVLEKGQDSIKRDVIHLAEGIKKLRDFNHKHKDSEKSALNLAIDTVEENTKIMNKITSILEKKENGKN